MFSSKPYEEFKREIKEIYKAGGLPSDPKTFVCDMATDTIFSLNCHNLRKSYTCLEGRYSAVSDIATKVKLTFVPNVLTAIGLVIMIIVAILVVFLAIKHPTLIGFYFMAFLHIVLTVNALFETQKAKETMLRSCINDLQLMESCLPGLSPDRPKQ